MKKNKVALITGITGQDGSYLAEMLLEKGYVVHGLKRRSSSFNTARIDHLYRDPHYDDQKFFLHYGDLSDSQNISNIIYRIQPDEVYNLAAQSHVGVSYESPEYTADVTGLGTLRILEAIKNLKKTKPLLDKKGSPQRVGIFESKEDIFNFIYDLLIGVRSHSKKRGKIRKIINLYPSFKIKKFLLKIVNKTFIGSN